MDERILCFGDGRFLRAFLGEALELGNRAGLHLGRIVCCTNTPRGDVSALMAAGCRYQVVTRGLSEGRPIERITQVQAVSRALNTFSEWPALLAFARSPAWSVAVSNTTEAGITWRDESVPSDAAPISFPARLAALLIERWRAGLPGVLVLPCELIDRNATVLKSLVLRHAAAWQVAAPAIDWLEHQVRWCDTLVDRIVSGELADAAAIRAGLRDPSAILVAAEPYHRWAICGNPTDAARFPLHQLGLATWVDDLGGERARKVRILNGGHTALAAICDDDTSLVRQAVDHPHYGPWLRRLLADEILPGLIVDGHGDSAMVHGFAAAVFDRLRNPSIDHRLADILLNTVAKWKTRCLPTVVASARRGAVATGMARVLASLIRQADRITDPSAERLRTLAAGADPANAVCGDQTLWGEDLCRIPGFVAAVAAELRPSLQGAWS